MGTAIDNYLKIVIFFFCTIMQLSVVNLKDHNIIGLAFNIFQFVQRQYCFQLNCHVPQICNIVSFLVCSDQNIEGQLRRQLL